MPGLLKWWSARRRFETLQQKVKLSRSRRRDSDAVAGAKSGGAGVCVTHCLRRGFYVNYGLHTMREIIQSETFLRWRLALKDRQALARVNARIRRLAEGNPGGAKPVREGVSELRIDYGPGYRVYFVHRGPLVIVLLAGGNKRTQDADIERAIAIAKQWKD